MTKHCPRPRSEDHPDVVAYKDALQETADTASAREKLLQERVAEAEDAVASDVDGRPSHPPSSEHARHT